jgi:hypothetical protein
MKKAVALLGIGWLLVGCFNSSSPARPAQTTVVVPPSGQSVVVCADGTPPPCH